MSDIKIRPAQIIGEDHAGRKRAYDKARYQAKKEETKARSRAWYAANASRARKTAAAWKKAHPERRRENNRRWALANPEKVKFSQSKYVANNKQEVIEMRKNWRARNRERRKTERREYMQNNPERAREYRRTRRIRKNQSPKGARKPIIEWEKRWRSKKTATCFWCTKKVKVVDCHTDHITPLAKGGAHSIENLCISCASCNHAKSSKPLPEWNSQLKQPVLL